jgi:uncharacterized membrane protein (DUF4010 family)
MAYENARGRADKQANDGKATGQRGQVNADDSWRLIVVAAISNLIFKAGSVAALGQRRLFFRVLPAYGVVIAAGILMLVYCYFAF